jgi:membrane-bound lytic murein transglycosylase C
MTPALSFLLALRLAGAPAAAQSSDDAEFESADREASAQDSEQKDFATLQAEQVRQFQQGLEEQREQYRKFVLQQWSDFQESSRKEWVDYGKKGDARSKVDFERGKVEVEVLVPVKDKAKVKELAEKKIAEQTRKVLSEKDTAKTEILKDQVRSAEGAPVTPKSADEYVKKELAPKMIVEEKPVVAEDGVPRLKVKVEIPLVENHMTIRAKRYKPQVDAAASRYGLEPALLFAVIQTESEFNPRARSQAPAFGLMQLMPKTAAREAFQFLHHEDKLVSPEYLYDPENNILLGATYLHLLRSRHYGKIRSKDNQQTLMIAAYNCGPGCVGRSVTAGRDVDAMTTDELVRLIKRAAPKETQAYVPRVRERMAAYRSL